MWKYHLVKKLLTLEVRATPFEPEAPMMEIVELYKLVRELGLRFDPLLVILTLQLEGRCSIL